MGATVTVYAVDGSIWPTGKTHATDALAKLEAAQIEVAGVYAGRAVRGTYVSGGEVETRRVCVLSTEHLSPAVMAILAGPEADWPVAGGRLAYGFYLYVHDDGLDGVPADLRLVFAWALGRFDYIQFDSDASPIEALATFDNT